MAGFFVYGPSTTPGFEPPVRPLRGSGRAQHARRSCGREAMLRTPSAIALDGPPVRRRPGQWRGFSFPAASAAPDPLARGNALHRIERARPITRSARTARTARTALRCATPDRHCESGGIGRRTGFRFQRVTPVRVRVPPFAPTQTAPSASGKTNERSRAMQPEASPPMLYRPRHSLPLRAAPTSRHKPAGKPATRRPGGRAFSTRIF